jgi:acyl-CoA thioesterase I
MMPRSPLVHGLLLGAALAMSALRGAAAAEAPNCRVPPEILQDDPKLVHTQKALRAKAPLTIVAIGGASTAGGAAGDGEAFGYPHRLEEALRRRHPGLAITVLNKGVARQTTAEMVARFARDVVPLRPVLVLWETGTVDAVRGADVDAFTEVLVAGIAALREHGLDVILVDMQYNPSTGSVINFEPYLEAMRHAADIADVYLLRRYEIMRYWSENGTFDFVDVPAGQRVRLAQDVYRCLGEAMAEAIDYAAE